MNDVLLDAGPLVALVSAEDLYHEDCVEQFDQIAAPSLTTWPVLAEVAWILRNDVRLIQRVLAAGDASLFRLYPLDESAFPWLGDFLFRYRTLPAQLADATLAYVAEREGIDTVFTLDRRDFSVYRFRRNRSFRILPSS